MEKVIISYSLSGNNDKLAEALAQELSAGHIKITEKKERSLRKIAFDMMLNMKPGINADFSRLEKGNNIIFVGPVWMGHIASPLKTGISKIKPMISSYSFVSISGGALGPNPRLEAELTKCTGIKPSAVIDLHIADIMEGDKKPKMEETSGYRVTPDDVKNLTGEIIAKLKQE